MATTQHGRTTHDPAGGVIMSNDIMSSMDYLPPDIHAEVFLKYGTDDGLDMLRMRLMGYERMVSQEEYSHFEKGHATVKTVVDDAVESATAGATVTYTVTNSAGDSTSGTTIGTIFPRVGEYVTFSNIGNSTYTTKGVVTVVSLPTASGDGTFTVQPIGGLKLPAVTAGGTIAVGLSENEIIVWSGGSGEASGVITPAISYWEKYTNNVQIIKEKVAQSGTALSNASYIKGDGKGVWSANLMDGEIRLYKKQEGAFLLGEGQDAMTGIEDASSEVNGDRTMTKGLIPTIEDDGVTSTYTAATILDDFSSWASVFEQEKVPRNIPIWFKMGKTLANSIDADVVDTYGATVTAEFIQKGINDSLYKKEVQGLNVGVSFIQINQRYYSLETYMGFSDPEYLGAKGFKYHEMGLMFPLKKARQVKGISAGTKIGTIGMVYKGIGGYSRKMIVDRMSGFGSAFNGEPITSEIDSTKYMWFTHFGAEFAEVNSMIKVTL